MIEFSPAFYKILECLILFVAFLGICFVILSLVTIIEMMIHDRKSKNE